MAYTPGQRAIIALSNRLSRGLPPRVRKALLEAEAVESHFLNLGYGDRDSEGPLQQRPSQGWGPASESATTDIRQFLQRALATNRGFRGTAGQLAQAVQRSAFPGRYDQHAAEAQRLMGLGGQGSGAIDSSFTMPAGSQTDQLGTAREKFVREMLAASRASEQGQPANIRGLLTAAIRLKRLRETPQPAQTEGAAVPGSLTATTPGKRKLISELFYDPLGAIKNGQNIAAIGGHSDHVHFASMNPQTMLSAITYARRLGLHVSENPFVGTVHPVHVHDSNHYKVIGSYRGRKIGAAVDVSGSPGQMAAYYRWVQRNL